MSKGNSKVVFTSNHLLHLTFTSAAVILLISTLLFTIDNRKKKGTSNLDPFFDHSQLPYSTSAATNTKDVVTENVKVFIKPKIAFVFAGSARSFVCSKVHWTIRNNLIDSIGGDPYVFVRISTEDNKNIKTGKGTLWTPQYVGNEINETLKILNPKVVQYFSFKNQIEEMVNNYPSKNHTAFRVNDQRRYSMYFHRCMAYKLMLQYEQENHLRFDWVVLVRLDAAWLEPVMPITSFANDRVWVTETGFVLFNDQFMLIPRQFSDYLYDLNTKVHKDVYCLGGPDVEKWKCNRTALIKEKYSPELIDLTLAACCTDVFKDNKDGYSETIHLRHLQNGNIPLSFGSFPVFLTRRRPDTTCFPECMRLTMNTKDWLAFYNTTAYPSLWNDIPPDPSGPSMNYRDKLICEFVHGNDMPWNPISAANLHAMIAANETFKNLYQLDYTQSLYSLANVRQMHPSIPLDFKQLEVWRIHPTWNVDGCLSFSFANETLFWDQCNVHFKRVGGLRYDAKQQFLLRVEPHTTRFSYIQSFNSTPHPAEDIHYPKVNVTRVIALNRDTYWVYRSRRGLQCLTAQSLRIDAAVTAKLCNTEKFDPLQTFLTVKGMGEGSHPLSTVGQLQLAANPSLCVAREGYRDQNDHNYFPSHHTFTLRRCSAFSPLVHYEFELIGGK